jgi:hypothetical protein
MDRVAAAAVEAALGDEQPRRRLSGARAVATGVAIATVARVAVKKAPGILPGAVKKVPGILPGADRISDLTASVRERLAENGWIDDEFEKYEDEDELVDEAELDEPDEEEPEDEEGEGPDDEDDEWEDEDDDTDGEGPDAASDEDEQDEGDEDEDEGADEQEGEPAPAIELGANGGGGQTEPRTPDLIGALSSSHRRPPVMGRGDERPDPAERPPEPPKRRRSSSKKSKAKAGKS